MNFIFKILLFPVSIVYGTVIWIRNLLYDSKIWKSKSFNFPVISVGNLTVGGTGKTPHVEYLIRYLSKDYGVATLSRGYRRKTKGFLLADNNSGAKDIGDEAKQIKEKFPLIQVAVCENRKEGIKRLIEKRDSELIILDDAYQHRKVKAGLSILLMNFYQLPMHDCLLPAGRLREHFYQKKRADIIIVTKCPENISDKTVHKLKKKINPSENQSLYFTTVKYDKIAPVFNSNRISLENIDGILLISGIAKSQPLVKHIKLKYNHVKHLSFPDHHFYSNADIQKIKNLTSSHKNKKSKKDALVFVKQKLDTAKWFIDAIKQRQHTLLSTMHSIFEFQKDFFVDGDEKHLKPMILKDIAEKIGLDISTISRVSNSKYIQTPFGIFPLKYFFSEGIIKKSGEEVSTREIKRILIECVDNEDKKHPLTDEKLVQILQNQSYIIARRTVAKYREQLGIPVARLRKQL